MYTGRYGESSWRNTAAPIIRQVLAAHPEPGPARVLALREAYPFGERKHHPYKIWLDEIARQAGTKTRLYVRTLKGRRMIFKEPDARQDLLFPAT